MKCMCEMSAASGWLCHELPVLLHWPHGAVSKPVHSADSGAGKAAGLVVELPTVFTELKASCACCIRELSRHPVLPG